MYYMEWSRTNLKRRPSSSQPLGSVNEYDNMVDDVEVDSEDGKALYSQDTPVREELQARGAEEDNLENDPIYVEGEQEVEETIEDVEEDNDNEEGNDDEEEMEDDIETEEDEDDISTDSSKEEEDIPREVQKKTYHGKSRRILK